MTFFDLALQRAIQDERPARIGTFVPIGPSVTPPEARSRNRPSRRRFGHSTLAMTMRYMHLAPIALRQAIELLDFGQPLGSAEKAAS